MNEFGFSMSSKKYSDTHIDEISFNCAGILTIGAEIELQIIDPQTLNLVSKSEELLALDKLNILKPEFYLSTVEINTSKCNNALEIEADLASSLDQVQTLAGEIGVKFATTGCHPFSRYADCVITPSKRYNELIDRNQWLTRRMTVYGLHIHIGVKNGDDCIRFNNFFLHFMPHLLALSASSPFWQGDDTGLAACRPTTYESLPTAGQPYQVNNWNEFQYLYQILKNCKAIDSIRDLWWDMRPSPKYGTLEIRVCDGLATLEETGAIIAYIHLLANWFNDNASWLEQVPTPPHWLSRENKWRVIRYGMEAELVRNSGGIIKLVKDDIREWLQRLAPYIKKLGYEKYVITIENIIKYGNSTTRQRQIYNETNSLKEVVKFNIEEFEKRKPIWHLVDLA